MLNIHLSFSVHFLDTVFFHFTVFNEVCFNVCVLSLRQEYNIIFLFSIYCLVRGSSLFSAVDSSSIDRCSTRISLSM